MAEVAPDVRGRTISAIDIALWDVKRAQALERPLHALLGSRRTEVSAYASDGCWLEPAERVADQASRFAAEGFAAIKVRFGRRDPNRDLATVDAVRRALGESINLLIDVNQGWDLERARIFGARLPDYGVRWLEEPLPSEDIAELAELREVLELDIVAGENAYMPPGAERLLESAAVDVLMPDLQRIGGVTGWLRTRELARTAGIPLSAHLFPEVSVHLLAAEDSGSLEYVSWLTPLLENPIEVRQGIVSVPQAAGIGLRFDENAISAHEVTV